VDCIVLTILNEIRRGVRREVTLYWEHESGDFGTILSSWPVFDVEPKCLGPRDYQHFPNESEPERNAELCPYHEANDLDWNCDVLQIIAKDSERKTFLKILEGQYYELNRVET